MQWKLKGNKCRTVDIFIPFFSAFPNRCIGKFEKPMPETLHTLYSGLFQKMKVSSGKLSQTESELQVKYSEKPL